jgi:hypothetical protein
MHKSKLSGFIIDCQTTDLAKAAQFWGDALGNASVWFAQRPANSTLGPPNGRNCCFVTNWQQI